MSVRQTIVLQLKECSIKVGHLSKEAEFCFHNKHSGKVLLDKLLLWMQTTSNCLLTLVLMLLQPSLHVHLLSWLVLVEWIPQEPESGKLVGVPLGVPDGTEVIDWSAAVDQVNASPAIDVY